MALKKGHWLKAFEKFVADIRIPSKEIVSDDPRGVPLVLWESQKRFLREVAGGLERGVHVFNCLKSRQLGATTVSLAIDVFWLAVHNNIKGCLVTDNEANRESNRLIIRQYVEGFPEGYFGDKFEIVKDNRDGMVFSNGSTLRFLVAGTKKKSIAWAEGSGFAFAHLCLEPNTPVVVENGHVKKIQDVEIGEEVLTHTGARTRVIDKLGQPNNRGPMVEITPWCGQVMRCSQEHKWPTQRGMVHARDLVEDDELVMPIRPITFDVETTQLPESLKAGNAHTNRPYARVVGRASGEVMEINEELGFAVGYYLAEGSISLSKPSKGRKGQPRPSYMKFSRHRDETAYADRACAALAPYMTSRTTHDRKNSLTSEERVYGTPLIDWFTQHFGRAETKRIPDYVFTWGEPFCRGLLAGMLCGDAMKAATKGNRPGSVWNAVELKTIRSGFAMQIRDIAASLGYGWASLRWKPAGVRLGRNEKEVWKLYWGADSATALRELIGLPPLMVKSRDWGPPKRWRIEDGRVYIKIRKLKRDVEVPYMWDLSVEHADHTFRTPWGATSNTEVSKYGDPAGLASLEEGFAQSNPNRLYIYEATANGFNHWRTKWVNGLTDVTQHSFFIGWWANDMNRVEKKDARFLQYGIYALTPEEQAKVVKVQSLYKWTISPEQLAWIRWKESQPDNVLLGQNQPWCLVAGTRVGTTRGILPIEEVRPGDRVSTGRVVAAGPTGEAAVWRLRTRRGYRLSGTGNHPLIGADGSEIEISAALNRLVRLQTPVFATEQYVIEWTEGPVTSYVDVTPDFARLIGLFMGDGSLSGSPSRGFQFQITCDMKDRDVIEECKRLIEMVLDENCYEVAHRAVGDGGYVQVKTTSRRVYDLFARLGLVTTITGRSQRRVHVPEFIWRSPKHIVKEFLKGLFEADGHSERDKDGVVFACKHEQFVKDVQVLLLGFGITSKTFAVMNKIKKNNDGKVYSSTRMELRAAEARKFFAEIGFISERKISVSANRPPLKNAALSVLRTKPIVLEDEVVEIENTGETATVYNLTTENPHWFDANGLLTHNTADDAFIQSGYNFFPLKQVDREIRELYETPRPFKGYRYNVEGDFFSFRLLPLDPEVDDVSQVELKIWEEPVEGAKYAIGFDPAYGRNDHKDGSAIVVLRCYADKVVQVAEYRSSEVEARHAAWAAFHICAAYRDCMINVELEGPGRLVMAEFEHLRQFLKAEMNAAKTAAMSKVIPWTEAGDQARWFLYHREDSFGSGYAANYQSSYQTKRQMLHTLRGAYISAEIGIQSIPLLREMSNVRVDGDDIGAPDSADEDKKDDRVFALGLAVLAWTNWIRKELIAQGFTYERAMNEEAEAEENKDLNVLVRKNMNTIVQRFLAKADEEVIPAPTWRERQGLS